MLSNSVKMLSLEYFNGSCQLFGLAKWKIVIILTHINVIFIVKIKISFTFAALGSFFYSNSCRFIM